MIKTLRPHQENAIHLLRSSLGRGKRRPMLQLPTGAGKTVVAAAIIEMALNKRKRCIFTVPAIELIDQSVNSFLHEGIAEVGVIQASHEMTDPSRPVQVASVQTLMRRPIPETDLVIIDEAHRMFDFVTDWMTQDAWKRVPFIGLSATPYTKGLGKWFDDLIIPATMQDLIDLGYLAPFRVFAPSHPDLSGVQVSRGDYVEGQLSEAMQKGKLVADIIDTWLEKGGNQPTLCFAVDRAHAKHLQQKFQEAGVPTGYMDAYTKREERDEIRRQFQAGEIKVVTNVGVLTTGVDWDVRVLILARPTKSEILYQQIIGRALRTAPGKEHALILDHSDTTLRLGFVTDIQHEALDDGRERQATKSEAPLPKECPKCAYLKPPRVTECPNCGFKPEHKAKGIACDDGELVELTAPNRKQQLVEQREWFLMLRWIGRERGYKPTWAAAQYRDKHGTWPPRPWDRFEPVEPTPAVRTWVKARMIAFAKARAA